MKSKKAVKKFTKTSQEWLDELEKLDAKSITLKPSENQWCMAELYDHVMRVAHTYQIPNLHKCINAGVTKGYAKNYKGLVIFDLNYLPSTKMRLESFPPKIATGFTPIIKPKHDLVREFKTFIEEVKNLEPVLETSDSSKKNKHPFFGWINATDWFRLIDIHIRHHLKQRERIKTYIFENASKD